jgi:hypothetical protein
MNINLLHLLSDWVQDKNRSQFALQALCWEKSHIPELVWRAGDTTSNLIESAHADVYREGIHCTLLGGIAKGQAFDTLKMRTLKVRAFQIVGPSSVAIVLSILDI